jgi:hypothetical protein
MITPRDRNIVQFVDKHGSITIAQCAQIFMNDSNCSYKIAQRRLSELVSNKYLKVSKTDTGENIYYTKKQPSYHDLLILSFYAGLVNCGCRNIHFEHPRPWINDDLKSDGLFIYEFGGYRFYNLLEVCWTHKEIPFTKYEDLFSSGEAHGVCDGEFPRLIVMDDTKHREPLRNDKFPVIQIDLNLKNLPLIFMD